MITLETLLVRLERDSLTKFLSKSVIKVLEAYDEDLVQPKNLRKLILDTIQTQAILQDVKTRGIIINTMKDHEAEEFAKFLGIKKWNNIHYKLLHTNFNKKIIVAAMNFFGKSYDEVEKISKEDQEKILPVKYLFDYQLKTVKEIQNKLEKSPHRALLHMPTGSGKTISAMKIVLLHLLLNPSTLVIWLAHNEELCEQALSEFQDMWKQAGDRQINTYRFFGTSKLNPLIITKGFMVASLLKMLGSAKKSVTFLAEMSQKTSLVIIDEAHQAIADKFSIVIEELAQNKGTKLLGLSATPGRKSDSTNRANIQLARFFANNKVMLNTGNENPVTFLIKKGYLAKPRFQEIPYESGILSNADKSIIHKNLDVPRSILEKLSEDIIRTLAIVKVITSLFKTHNKIIVFASSVKHARDISLILSAKKYKSYYLTSNTSHNKRVEILCKYKKPNTPLALCNYGILTTGFDAPETSAVVIARPTKSSVLYAQMVGRGMRGPKAGGNKTCEILTTNDNIDEFINITNIFTQWEKAWNE